MMRRGRNLPEIQVVWNIEASGWAGLSVTEKVTSADGNESDYGKKSDELNEMHDGADCSDSLLRLILYTVVYLASVLGMTLGMISQTLGHNRNIRRLQKGYEKYIGELKYNLDLALEFRKERSVERSVQNMLEEREKRGASLMHSRDKKKTKRLGGKRNWFLKRREERVSSIERICECGKKERDNTNDPVQDSLGEARFSPKAVRKRSATVSGGLTSKREITRPTTSPPLPPPLPSSTQADVHVTARACADFSGGEARTGILTESSIRVSVRYGCDSSE